MATAPVTSTTTAPSVGQVVPIEREGALTIELVGSDPPPSSSFSGCGDHVRNCTGRLRMSFRLTSPVDGVVDKLLVYLHATSQTACLIGETGRLRLRAGEPLAVDVLLDRADDVNTCRTPLTMATMDAVTNATADIASRQAWSLTYRFDP